MKLKRMLKTALAAAPLVVGMASPASACLLTGASDTAVQNSPQIEEGPVGTGPTAPMSGLQNADERNGDAKNLCEEMCDPSGQFSDDEEG